MILPFCAAWIGHTSNSREMAQDILSALDAIGMKHESAAAAMGLESKDFSKQLAGAKPLNLYRLGFLPVGFHTAWLRFRSQRIGGAFVTADERAFVLSAAHLGIKRMRKMVPVLFQDRQVG